MEFLAILTNKPGECYVICTEIIPEHGVRFTKNSWRGDHYEPELREAVKQWEWESEVSNRLD